jgi:predicted small secreted protein
MKKSLLNAMRICLIVAAMAMLLASCSLNSGTGSDATAVPATDAATEAAATDVVTEKPTEEITQGPTDEPTPSPVPTAAGAEKGINVALDAEVDVSSTTGTSHVQWGWSYEYINDGIITDSDALSYGWTTAVGVNMDNPDQEEWVEFKLDKYFLIDTVIVYPTLGGSYFPVDYEIQVSMDGREYTTVARVEGDNHAAKADTTPVKLEFEAVTARYVRFLATKLYDMLSPLGDGILCQLAEIEILTA